MILNLNLIFLCVTSRMSIMGGVGIEVNSLQEPEENNNTTFTEIYENIQNIISKNNLIYDKFFINNNKNKTTSIHVNKTGTKPIPIPKPYK